MNSLHLTSVDDQTSGDDVYGSINLNIGRYDRIKGVSPKILDEMLYQLVLVNEQMSDHDCRSIHIK
ncbi:hypothetical protein BLOT_010838 [Blomia tropicalis]|nr:hypothetical protein BLOT_010838 [Blomia tropicalis]